MAARQAGMAHAATEGVQGPGTSQSVCKGAVIVEALLQTLEIPACSAQGY